uniref:Protein MAK10 homolog n=1 Tax=Panagrolaimus superbus TaxID=310955 RepID=A0A914Y1P8_9BILA
MIFPYNDHIFGKISISDLIINSMQVTVAPFILNKEFNFSEVVHQEWQIFLKDASGFFIDLIQAFGMNLVRQREKIGHFMEEATSMYLKSEAIDRKIAEYLYVKPKHAECINRKPYPLSTFLANHFMELMSYYIELGFKLELFVDHELPYIYWYLGEVISLWRHRFWMKAKEYIDMEKCFILL